MRTARVTSSRLRTTAFAAAAAVTLLAACSSPDGATAGGPSPAAPPPAAETTAPTAAPATTSSIGASTSAPVPDVLRFTTTTVGGAPFSGAELAGRKTVLWFWAPWCTVCARAAAGVKRDAAALGPDVRVVGVAGLSANAADMRGFVDRSDLSSLTHLADTSGDLYARFGVAQQDTFILLRPDGTLSRHPSYSQDVDLVALARQTFS